MANPFILIINQMLPEPQASLLAGILFGMKKTLPQDFYTALITTSTIHITALSGQNISILTKVIAEIALPLGRRMSLILSLVGVLSFVLFVGFEPTLIRASLMGSLSLLATYFGRKTWSLLSLLLTAGVMLLIEPSWIASLSFQLSFLATFGIILFSQSEKSKPTRFTKELVRDLKTDIRTSLSAQAFTVPLIFLHFHRVSLISPLTNVLIGWTIAPIMILGFGMSVLGWLFLPLGKVIGYLVWVPLTYLISVVEITAKIPFASISF